jgi:glycerophosphoryl diester phosphodiesterase
MRFTPQIRALEWLVANPIAHRGLHHEAMGLVENCESSFAAAMREGFSIETDVELSKDGEAMIFHDDNVDRVLDAKGAVKSFTSAELKKMNYRQGRERIQTLAELLEQIRGKTTLVVEIKSLWDDDFTLTDRALKVISGYNGPVCVMSFDPTLIARAAVTYPDAIRGITADRVIDPYYNMLPIAKRLSMQNYWHLPYSRPHFVSFDFSQLPFQPITQFREAGHPILTWTIHSDEQAALARRYCDQITFENFIPAVR